MLKLLKILVLAGSLASCQSDPVFLKAINYDVGPAPETASLKLNGISLKARDGWGMTHEQAEGFLQQHKGKTVNYFGMVHDITVHGSRAMIEVVPERTGIMQMDCTVQELLRRYGGKNCEQQKAQSFTTVTCHIENWATLHQKTKGLLLANLKSRKDDFRKWDGIHVEGRLSNLKDMSRNLGYYHQERNFEFGVSGGVYAKTWHYETFVIKPCKVRGYDGKIIS